MEYLGTSPTAGFLPGIAGVAVASVISIFYLEKRAARARRMEESFADFNKEHNGVDRICPPLWLSCVPLVTIVSLLSVFGIDPLIALSAGVVTAFILLARFLPQPLEVLNEGTRAAMMP